MYKTGQPATWGEGDWNGDGVYNQLDTVLALQAGIFKQGPYAEPIMEPSPDHRGGAAMAWLDSRGRAILFGGRHLRSRDDSFQLSQQAGWQKITTDRTPRMRWGHSLVADGSRRTCSAANQATSMPTAIYFGSTHRYRIGNKCQ